METIPDDYPVSSAATWVPTQTLGYLETNSLMRINGKPYLITGNPATNLHSQDTVNLEVRWFDECEKISVLLLSDVPWHPMYMRISSSHTATGFGAEEEQPQFFHVLLNANGQLTKTWIQDKEFSKFTWT